MATQSFLGIKPTAEQLQEVLALHRKYWLGEAGGVRANLGGANLYGANLRGADLRGDTILADGVVWKVYVDELVPSLLTAGGRSLDEMAQPRIWDCHSWENCPMAEAFSVHELSNIPALYRAPANLFIQLYDGPVAPLNDLAALRKRWNLAPLPEGEGEACAVSPEREPSNG
jgi:hypothetical protein